jgi:hypothetical protein
LSFKIFLKTKENGDSFFLENLDSVFSRVSADSFTLAGGRSVDFFAASRAAFFSTAGHFIDGRPRATLGFFAAQAARFITFFDVSGLAFLFAGIAGFVAFGHGRDFVFESSIRNYAN